MQGMVRISFLEALCLFCVAVLIKSGLDYIEADIFTAFGQFGYAVMMMAYLYGFALFLLVILITGQLAVSGINKR